MDQVALFSDVRPAPPADDDVAMVCDRARDRVAAAFQDPPRRRRRRLTFALAGGGVLAAGAAATAVALLAGSAVPAGPGGSLRSFVTTAYTVRPSHDGTITVTIRQLQDPAGLQRALAADGAPALVRYVPDRFVHGTWHGVSYSGVSPVCQYNNLPRSPAESKAVGLVFGGSALFWIRPSAMPKGTVVFIQDSLSKNGNIAEIDLLTSNKLPRCVPAKPPTPEQIVSPQAGQPAVAPKGRQPTSVPRGYSGGTSRPAWPAS